MKELNSKSVKKKMTDNLIRDSYFKDGGACINARTDE